MQLPQLPVSRVQVRRTLLLLWFPSIVLTLVVAGVVLAQGNHASPPRLSLNTNLQSGSLFAAAPPHSQVLGDSIVANSDPRAKIIARYLRDQDSPLASHAGTFVTVADKYNLDWRLLVAIAGKESSFGKYIPPGSYNAWGWGIPTGASSGIAFSSWDDGIEKVGSGLRRRYFNQGLTTLKQIEAVYTPPSAAQPDHPWANGVAEFMNELEHY